MRRYMIDPDNEERLLKIPPHVVAAIKSEALDAARDAVTALPCMTGKGVYYRDEALAAIDALREERK